MSMNTNLNQPLPLKDMHEAVSAWFLGPRAENFGLLKTLFEGVLDDHARVREQYYPEDGSFITASIQSSKTFQDNVAALQKEVAALSGLLNQYSVPFFSPRYIGHMCMEMSLPSIIGYMMTIMFNPNNVAFEASPVTTLLELEVGNQLCSMLGYPTNENIKPWGHIACDGTVSNMESMWAARNLKYYPLSIREAMDKGGPLNFIANDFHVTTCDDPSTPHLLKDLDAWQLLNLPVTTTLEFGTRLTQEYGITAEFLASALSPYLVQSAGKEALFEKYGITQQPQYLVSSTKHYSWPKSAALVGIGSDNCVGIPVDVHARIDVSKLRAMLQYRLDNRQAVYAVVAIIGSTEEGSVDPLDEIVALRDEFGAKGLSFIVHADAAWGGYFASMIRDPPPGTGNRWDDQQDEEGSRDFVPSITMRESTVKQFHALALADSITIDPHKAGYIPYPAGGLCYRDGRMRFLLTWTAPYLHDSDQGESIGIYGIEGSKPGAPAAACYLHHAVVGLHKQGHGGLLGEVSFTCRRMSAHWAAMSDEQTDFIVVPFNPLEREAEGEKALAEEKAFIRKHILRKSNEAIIGDQAALDKLCALGSDLNINAFACNFRINGHVNEDVEEANYLNKRVFDRLSLTGVREQPRDTPLFLSSTIFGPADYAECARNFQKRLGLETESMQELFVLRNVVMSPFQGAGDFVSTIADTFQKVLEEEVQHVVERNTVCGQVHEFVMQGVDKLYLVYRPLFHHANGRQQLILRADVTDVHAWRRYQAAKKSNPDSVYTLQTATKLTIDEVVNTLSLEVHIFGPDLNSESTSLSNIKVVKSRSLQSRWRDRDYPIAYTPFYLYGSETEQHMDHMLLRAPNAQISSDRVTLDVRPPLSAAELQRGVIVHVARPERALQPLSTTNISVFKPCASFAVTVVRDANAATVCGVAHPEGAGEVARGTLTLGASVFFDCEALNREDFAPDMRVSATASADSRAAWAGVVQDRLGLKPAGGKVLSAPPGSGLGAVVEAGGELVGGTITAGSSATQGAVRAGGDIISGMSKAGQTLLGGI